MAWSNSPNNPIDEEIVNNHKNSLPDEIVDELEYKFNNGWKEIEQAAKNKYATPSEAPDAPATAASMAGRQIKNNVDNIQNFFFKNKFAPSKSDSLYGPTLEYIGYKALKNGN